MFLTELTKLYFLVDLKNISKPLPMLTNSLILHQSCSMNSTLQSGIGPKIQLTHLIACNLPVILLQQAVILKREGGEKVCS